MDSRSGSPSLAPALPDPPGDPGRSHSPLQIIARAAARALGARGAAIRLGDSSFPGSATFGRFHANAQADDRAADWFLNDGVSKLLAERMARSPEPLWGPDRAALARALDTDLPLCTDSGSAGWLAVPTAGHPGSPPGVLSVVAGECRIWTPEDLELLQDLALLAPPGTPEPEATDWDFVANLSRPAYALNARGLFQNLNRAAERVLGRSAEDLLGQPFSVVIHPDQRDEVADVFLRIVAREVTDVDLEVRILRPDGQIRLLDLSVNALVEGDRVATVHGVGRDTSRERATAEALRESEERLRIFFDENPSTLFVVNGDGVIEAVNAYGAGVLGFSRDELLGRRGDMLFPEEDRERAQGMLREVLAAGPGEVRDEELRMRRADGEVIWVRHRARVISGAGGDDAVMVVCEDVTDRKAAEGALREREEEFRALFEQSPVGVFLYDGALRITAANSRLAALLQVQRERLVGLPLNRSRDRSLIPALEAGLRGESAHFEGRYIATLSDAELWVSARISPLRNDAGEILGGVAMIEDVTVEREVREQLQRRDRILEAASHAATRFLGGGDWRDEISDVLARVGEAADVSRVHLFQAEEAEGGGPVFNMVGTWSSPDLPPDMHGPLHQRWSYEDLGLPAVEAAHRRGEEAQEQIDDLPDAARPFWMARNIRALLSIPVFVDGRWWGVLGVDECRRQRFWPEAEREVFRVLTRVLSAALARQSAEVRLSAIIHSALDAIISVDEHRVIQVFNSAAEKLLGTSADEALGTPVDRFIPEIHRAAHMERMSRKDPGEESPAMERTVTALRADGTEVPVEATVSRARSGDRQLFTITMRDVSEKRELEAQLRHAQKMEAVGRLAGGVAHDFNNMLTVVQGNLALLEDAVVHDPEARAELKEAQEAAVRSAKLTGQLLAFSRRQILRPQAIDLWTVVRDLEPMVRRLIGEDVDLQTVRDGEPGAVKADPGQIEQVLMNLVVNARDALPGGGRIRIRVGSQQVVTDTEHRGHTVAAGGYARIDVEDSGEGMETDVLEQIFDPFFTTKGVGEGTGLGLATVYGIIKQSGGFIWANSEPGRGTRFRILLPTLPEESTDLQPPLAATGRIGRRPQVSRRILLAEDEEAVRRLLKRLLERLGYRVLCARDGPTALALAREAGPVDLLISDVVMPGMNGRELVRRFRVDYPGVPVLYMSGYTDDAVLRSGIEVQDVHFISKPVRIQDLDRELSVLLRDRAG